MTAREGLAIAGLLTAGGSTAAQIAGDRGEAKVDYSRPSHAAIATGLMAGPAIEALTTGKPPDYVTRQLRQQTREQEANAKPQFEQIPSSAPGLRLMLTQNTLSHLLTDSALKSLSTTGSTLKQFTQLASRFAELGRNSNLDQRQNFNDNKWVDIANQWLGMAGNTIAAHGASVTTNSQSQSQSQRTVPTTSPELRKYNDAPAKGRADVSVIG